MRKEIGHLNRGTWEEKERDVQTSGRRAERRAPRQERAATLKEQQGGHRGRNTDRVEEK